MAGILERIGATSTAKQLVLLVFLLTGQLLVLAFAFPEAIGESLSASLLILAAMSFVGSGLVYLSLLPVETGDASPA